MCAVLFLIYICITLRVSTSIILDRKFKRMAVKRKINIFINKIDEKNVGTSTKVIFKFIKFTETAYHSLLRSLIKCVTYYFHYYNTQ